MVAVVVCEALATPGPARADETYIRCIDATSTSTAWAECGWAWVKREDVRLSAVWRRVFEPLVGQTRADLLADRLPREDLRLPRQRLPGQGRAGAGFPSCVAEVMAARTRHLENFGRQYRPGT